MTTQDVRLEEFLDLAGHELRIPITALKGQLQLMQRRWRKQGASPEQLSDLDRMLYYTERLNSMLQVMLDAFHAAEGDLQLLPAEAEYDLGDLIARLLTTGSASHAIHFPRPTDEPPIMGNWDRTRIETVVSILLANAIKYDPSGEITVTLTREGSQARIEVSDRGVGVPAKERARIFAPYTHGSNVENAGMGLGLYVAREIVRAHGGQIGVKPRKDGGSVFWFTLPLARIVTLSERAAQASVEHEADPRPAARPQTPARPRKPAARKATKPALEGARISSSHQSTRAGQRS